MGETPLNFDLSEWVRTFAPHTFGSGLDRAPTHVHYI